MLIEPTATPWPRGSRALCAGIGSIHDPCQVRLGRVQTGSRRASHAAHPRILVRPGSVRNASKMPPRGVNRVLRTCTNIMFNTISFRPARPQRPPARQFINNSIRSSELVGPCESGLEPGSAIYIINQINSTNYRFGDPSRSRIKRLGQTVYVLLRQRRPRRTENTGSLSSRTTLYA